jgi:hypothetical protein
VWCTTIGVTSKQINVKITRRCVCGKHIFCKFEIPTENYRDFDLRKPKWRCSDIPWLINQKLILFYGLKKHILWGVAYLWFVLIVLISFLECIEVFILLQRWPKYDLLESQSNGEISVTIISLSMYEVLKLFISWVKKQKYIRKNY